MRRLGELALRRDPPEVASADAAFREAMALAAELGMRPLVAHVHAGLVALRYRTGEPHEAHEHVTTALAMYREMAMTHWPERLTRETAPPG